MLVSSIAPLFVKLPAEVKLLNPVVLSGSIRRTDPVVVVNGPFTTTVAFVISVPRLSNALDALTVTFFSVIDCPAAFVSVPGPLNVTPVATTAVVAFVMLVVRFAVRLSSDSVPGPPMLPALWFSVPPLSPHVRPLPIVIVPVFVKLGAVPLWVSVKSAAVASIVPLLVCAALT